MAAHPVGPVFHWTLPLWNVPAEVNPVPIEHFPALDRPSAAHQRTYPTAALQVCCECSLEARTFNFAEADIMEQSVLPVLKFHAASIAYQVTQS